MDARRERHSWSAAFTSESLHNLAEMYSPAPSDGDLDDALATQNAVYLGGDIGSGRHAAAWLALARRHDHARVVGVTVAPGRRLLQALDSDAFRPDHGHVVDAGAAGLDLMDLATLQERAGRAGATAIVIGPPLRRGSDLSSYAVRHRRAEAAEMLRRQLLFRVAQNSRCVGRCDACVRDCVPRWVHHCLDNRQLATYLRSGLAANEVESLAVAIAAEASADLDLDRLFGGLLPNQLRLQAREILRARDDENRDDGQRPGGNVAYRRAFRVAFAVFDGVPMASVFSAAGSLAVLLRAESAPTDLAGLGVAGADGVDAEVDRLLPDGMRAAPDDQPSAGAPRTARVANEQLASALIDVAWNDFGLGDRMLTWLDGLIADPQPLLRDRAAMVAGRLGSYDFDRVSDLLIRRWGYGRLQRTHRAAGLALLQCAYDTRLHAPLRGLMQQWVRGNVYSRDSIAWAYAFGIGQLLPYAGIHHLRAVAGDASQRRNSLVAIGTENTYATSRAAELVGELVDWARSGEERVQRHAAQSFLRLARRSDESSTGLWPELLTRMRADDLAVKDVAELWMLALSYPASAASAWRVLTYWVMWGGRATAVADQVVAVIAELTTVPEMRRRLRHQIRHVWREQLSTNSLLPTIAETAGGV